MSRIDGLNPPPATTLAAKIPNWLGDAVLCLPALRALADCSRRGPLLVLASPLSAEIAGRVAGTLPYSVSLPGGSILNSAGALLGGASLLRSWKPVMILSFTKSLTSSLMCRLGGVPRRIGFADSRGSLLYTDRVKPGPRGRHLAETYAALPESIGLRVADAVPRLQATDDDLAKAVSSNVEMELVTKGYVCFFPGARFGPAKRWHPSRFALLGDTIADRLDKKVVLLGGKGDSEACKAVEAGMSRPAVNLCGRLDLSTLVGLLSLSYAAVANDSGGMHLAAALGIPVVGLFFSTDPAWTGPVSPRSRALYHKMACSPCFRRDCSKGTPCTLGIEVQEVMDALAGVAEGLA